nr:serine/threonine-protein kinase CTR1-like isoform X1 [Ipomoea batatas]GMD79815.1 serine/threonine-protein kinase CTR1-like isoform X1 [Ipomoea batatas]
MPGRRSNYALLSQIPDDNFHQLPKFTAPGAGVPAYESHSGEKNKTKGDKGFDWDLIDHRMIQSQNRIGTLGYPMSIGQLNDGSGDLRLGCGGSSSSKSWAQQTEESY